MLGQFVSVIAGAAGAALAITAVWVWLRIASVPAPAAISYGAVTRDGAADDAAMRGARMALRWGLGLGVGTGIVIAYLRETTTLVNGEFLAVGTLAPLVVGELALVVRALARPRAAGVAVRALAGAVVGLAALRAMPGVLERLADLRDPGLATVSTDAIMQVIGFGLGAGLVVLTAVVVARAAAGASARFAAWVLAGATVVAAATHLVTITQYLLARRMISLPRPGFRAIVWAINHEGLTLYALLAILLMLPVAARATHHRMARAAGGSPAGLPGLAAPAKLAASTSLASSTGLASPAEPATPAVEADVLNPAQRRLARATNRSRLRFARATLVAYAGIIMAATVGVAIDSAEPELSPPEEFQIVGDEAVIPLERFEDGHLHRFAYTTTSGTVVRFIVIKKNGVAYGVGLDACEICGPTGYYERAGKIICRLCDVVMNIATIGFKGGCNPIPLDHEVDAGALHVQLADLEAAAEVFA
ncbi:MAG: DUF2318 domain-containing protein [Bifidobacteriaceae bacterium]|jgi:hypothetical protein|nr:DUF2318 domain-containing protein [Bifidobacteriaceae bacterium]